jgi:hypothetical protein
MSETEVVKGQLKRMLILAGAPHDPDAAQAWVEVGTEILREVGEARFRAGVERCLREMHYFPTPKQLRDMVPSVLSDESRNGRTCVKCNRVPFGLFWVWEEGQREPGLRRCDHIVDADSVPYPSDPPKFPPPPKTEAA